MRSFFQPRKGTPGERAGAYPKTLKNYKGEKSFVFSTDLCILGLETIAQELHMELSQEATVSKMETVQIEEQLTSTVHLLNILKGEISHE